MQKKLNLLLLFLAFPFALNGYIQGFLWYTTPLSLHLVKEEYESFLDAGKNKSETEWCNALKDVILLESDTFYRNPTSVKKILHSLRERLHKRIQKIENQIQHKYRYNYRSLAAGTVCLAISAGFMTLAYAIYSMHKKDTEEYAAIVDRLEKDGVSIKVTDWSLFVYHIKKQSHDDDAKRLVILINATRHYNTNYVGFLGTCAGFTVIPLLAAIASFMQAYDPDGENKYLPNYKNLLALVEKLQQEDYNKWAIAQHNTIENPAIT